MAFPICDLLVAIAPPVLYYLDISLYRYIVYWAEMNVFLSLCFKWGDRWHNSRFLVDVPTKYTFNRVTFIELLSVLINFIVCSCNDISCCIELETMKQWHTNEFCFSQRAYFVKKKGYFQLKYCAWRTVSVYSKYSFTRVLCIKYVSILASCEFKMLVSFSFITK